MCGDIDRESQVFLLHLYNVPLPWGCYCRNSVTPIWLRKTDLPSAEPTQYQSVADGQTDGQTDRIPISISPLSMLARDKNSILNAQVLKLTKVSEDGCKSPTQNHQHTNRSFYQYFLCLSCCPTNTVKKPNEEYDLSSYDSIRHQTYTPV